MSFQPFRVHMGPRAERTMRPSEPVVWRSSAAGAQDTPSPSSTRPCLVCRQNEARYTCPKCWLVYCSKDCYGNHKGSLSDCTERFYHDRVMELMKLETKAKQEDFNRTLNRIHKGRQGTRDISAEVEEPIDKEELIQLLEVLELGDDQELSALLRRRPQLGTALNASLQRGDLCDWVVKPWHPWWRPRLLVTPLKVEESFEESESDDEICVQILDERFLECPPFSSLRPKGKNVPSRLRFNLLEILSSLVSTLHLYHGFQNAIELPIDAANHLIHSSQVLSNDFRFDNVEAVLVSVSGRFSRDRGASLRRENSGTIIRDIAMLCRNRRLICRALLEAADILSAAIDRDTHEPDERLCDIKNTKSAERKLMYYLSWSLDGESSPCLETLSEDVNAWLTDWEMSVEPNTLTVTIR